MWTTRQWHKPSTENAETCDEVNHVCGAGSERVQGRKTISSSRGQEFMKLGSTPTGIFIEDIPTIPGWCLCAKLIGHVTIYSKLYVFPWGGNNYIEWQRIQGEYYFSLMCLVPRPKSLRFCNRPFSTNVYRDFCNRQFYMNVYDIFTFENWCLLLYHQRLDNVDNVVTSTLCNVSSFRHCAGCNWCWFYNPICDDKLTWGENRHEVTCMILLACYVYDITCLILWQDTRHKERMVYRNGPNCGRMIHRLWIPLLERMVPWDGFYC